MKQLMPLAAALLGTVALVAFRTPTPEGIEPGTDAPEITSGQWFNHIGAPLSLAELRGQAVLIEFWATW